MRDVIVLKVQNSLGVLNNGRGVRGDEEFNGLRSSILAQEGARLTATNLRAEILGHEQAVVLLDDD